MDASELGELVRQLARIGAALSSERDLDVLLEMIVDELRRFTRADGGTLFLLDPTHSQLDWKIVQNESLCTRVGGTSGQPVDEAVFRPLSLSADGEKVHAAVHVARTGEPVNIADVYDEHDAFDFDGPLRFDREMGYRTRSMLVVPVAHFDGGVVGVLQLINARSHDEAMHLIPFSPLFEELTVSLASQAAVALRNAQLIRELEVQFDGFIQVIATAIDEKSPYTSGHVHRVTTLAMSLARAMNDATDGPFAGVSFDEDQLHELFVAGWMHDVGKIAIPEYVVDKATKLSGLHDRIDAVRARTRWMLASRRADALASALHEQLGEARGAQVVAAIDAAQTGARDEAARDLAFIERCNQGAEFLPDGDLARLRQLAALRWTDADGEHRLLSDDELKHLSIRRGTLTIEERDVIRDHARISIDMLEQLPFSEKYRQVPEIAGAHHEKLNGKGYPRGLAAPELSLRARILAVADIFEALTAADRPYKQPTPLSGVHRILGFMLADGELDPTIVRFGVESGVFDQYARDEVSPAQHDVWFADAPPL